MAAKVLDGKRIADTLLGDLAVRVGNRVAGGKSRPGLAVVLVGCNSDDEDSADTAQSDTNSASTNNLDFAGF